MAICWSATISQLDSEFVFAPERYSARRNAHLLETTETIPLHEIAQLVKSTANPAQTDPNGQYVVLDTTHAVEGRIQFNSLPVKGNEVGSVKRPVRVGSVMVSRLRTYLRQIAYADGGFAERYSLPIVCSTEFYIFEPLKGGKSIAFLIPYLLSESVQTIFANAQEGGHHPRIHASVLLELRVPANLLEISEKLSERVIEAIRSLRDVEDIFEECATLVRDQGKLSLRS
jgi:hypothetical protein